MRSCAWISRLHAVPLVYVTIERTPSQGPQRFLHRYKMPCLQMGERRTIAPHHCISEQRSIAPHHWITLEWLRLGTVYLSLFFPRTLSVSRRKRWILSCVPTFCLGLAIRQNDIIITTMLLWIVQVQWGHAPQLSPNDVWLPCAARPPHAAASNGVVRTSYFVPSASVVGERSGRQCYPGLPTARCPFSACCTHRAAVKRFPNGARTCSRIVRSFQRGLADAARARVYRR